MGAMLRPDFQRGNFDRAGNPERESTIEHLNHAFAHGYLTKDDLDMRVHGAFAAITMGDLRGLVHDLPGMPEPKSHVKLHRPVQTYKSMPDGGKALVWAAAGMLAVLYTVLLSVYAHAAHSPHLGMAGAMEQAIAMIFGIPTIIGFFGRASYISIEGT